MAENTIKVAVLKKMLFYPKNCCRFDDFVDEFTGSSTYFGPLHLEKCQKSTFLDWNGLKIVQNVIQCWKFWIKWSKTKFGDVFVFF